MIANLKPYQEYKDSGLSWLGKIPAHWDPMRLKRVLRPIDRRSATGEETLLSLRRDHGVVIFADHFSRPSQGATNVGFKLVRRGQLVVNRMQANNGLIFHSRLAGLVSPDYSVFEGRVAVSMDYLSALLRTPAYRSHFRAESTGLGTGSAGFLRLYDDKLLQTAISAPPLPEQEGIVRFLEWANRRLEAAIRTKRKVIALLNEQRQAIVHRVVTRGLDPSVPLKPSGIPWLGDIPEHWEVRRLRHLIEGRLTYGANEAAEFTNPDWPRYIRITDFSLDGTLKFHTFRSLPPSIASDYLVSPGDILFARSGATVGKAFLVVTLTGAACHAGYLIRARPARDLVQPEYLFAFTQSRAFSAWRDSTFNTATIQNIGADKYANLPIPLPPLQEQQTILESLTTHQQPILAATSRLDREIELLKEYRTRLVADVVTGKLDVREAAARLLKEPLAPVEEVEPADDLDAEEEDAE